MTELADPPVQARALLLEPIKEREAAASKGPWTSWQFGNSTMEDGLLDHIAEVKGLQRPWEPTWVGWAAAKNHFKSFFRQQDAEFIAHAREDVPALIAEVEQLRAALAGREPALPPQRFTDRVNLATQDGPLQPLDLLGKRVASYRGTDVVALLLIEDLWAALAHTRETPSPRPQEPKP